jgi:hypothetical protein
MSVIIRKTREVIITIIIIIIYLFIWTENGFLPSGSGT